MLELRIDIDQTDYDTLIPMLIPLLIKNPIAAKTALAGYKLKTMGMTQKDKDAFAAKMLSDNKNKIITTLNSKISEKGVKGYVVGFDADVL